MAGNKKKNKIPITSATLAARQSLIQSDVLGLEATRSRGVQETRSPFGGRRLRAAGSLTDYLVGQGGGSPPPPPGRRKVRKPPAKRTGIGKARYQRIKARVNTRRVGLDKAGKRNRIKQIVVQKRVKPTGAPQQLGSYRPPRMPGPGKMNMPRRGRVGKNTPRIRAPRVNRRG